MDTLPIFDRSPSEFTFEDFKRLYDESISPVSFEFDWQMSEDFGEIVHYGIWKGRQHEVSGLGTFKTLAEWSGGDGKPMGCITQHIESGTILITEGTYSSWDSSEWETFVEGEPFTFTEVRYREKS